MSSSLLAMGQAESPFTRRRRTTPSLMNHTLLMALALYGLLLPVSVAAQTDQCNLYNRISDLCDVQTICSNCVSTSGCKFDILLGRCDNRTDSVDLPGVTYCATNDTKCPSCAVTASKPVCYGEDYSCICPVMCTVVESERSACKQEMPITNVWLSFGALAFALPFLLFIQRKCNEPRGFQHMLYNRRRRAARRAECLRREQERDHTRDLTLAEWRDHREQHKLEMGEIELKTCYLLFKDGKVPPASTPPPLVLQERSTVSSEDDDPELSNIYLDSVTHQELKPVQGVQQRAADEGDGDINSDGSDQSGQQHVSVAVDDRS